jgi:hypothetical protein
MRNLLNTFTAIVMRDQPQQNVQKKIAAEHPKKLRTRFITAKELSTSPVVGIWKHRKDMTSSTECVRQMRYNAEHREKNK